MDDGDLPVSAMGAPRGGSPLNQRQLECFFAVARELHFRRAAEGLHLGQGTVSEAVAALERSVGAQLFHRTTRTVELTAAGYELLAATLGPYERLAEAFGSVQAVRRPPGLRLAHTPELGQLVLPRLIAAQATAAGDAASPVTWIPRRLHTHDQIAAVRSGAVGLGLCWQPQVDDAELSAVEIARIPCVAVLRADDPLADRPHVAVGDLQGRRLLITPRSYNVFLGGRIDSALATAGIAPDRVEEFLHFTELSFAVATGVAVVGIHPASIAVLNTTPGLVFRALVEPSVHISMVVLGAATLHPAAREVTEALRDIGSRIRQEIARALTPT